MLLKLNITPCRYSEERVIPFHSTHQTMNGNQYGLKHYIYVHIRSFRASLVVNEYVHIGQRGWFLVE